MAKLLVFHSDFSAGRGGWRDLILACYEHSGAVFLKMLSRDQRTIKIGWKKITVILLWKNQNSNLKKGTLEFNVEELEKNIRFHWLAIFSKIATIWSNFGRFRGSSFMQIEIIFAMCGEIPKKYWFNLRFLGWLIICEVRTSGN